MSLGNPYFCVGPVFKITRYYIRVLGIKQSLKLSINETAVAKGEYAIR